MKKANVTISYDEEKLQALQLYLGRKNQTIEQELVSATETLYNKTVPTGVREFIDMKAGDKKPMDKPKGKQEAG